MPRWPMKSIASPRSSRPVRGSIRHCRRRRGCRCASGKNRSTSHGTVPAAKRRAFGCCKAARRRNWTTQILPAHCAEVYLDNSNPEAISLRAVDRVGNLSEPAIWTPEKPPPADSPPPRGADEQFDIKNWFWKGCKPNSVCPESFRGRESFVSAADTRNPSRFRGTGAGRSGVPYLALHPMGFSVPRRLRFARCALTAPFHPCPDIVTDVGAV